MKDIFISYSRKDGTFVSSLRESLETHDLETWLDVDDIPPSARWRPEVVSAIESHGSFGFVVSPDSLKSEECRKELDHAVECGKRLIPILYRAVDNNDVPESIRTLNWILFDDKDRFEKNVEKLVSAIQTDLEWNRDLARLLVQARRWDARERDDSFVLRGVELQDSLQLLARAEMGMTPRPTALQKAYIEASKVHEASEIQRWKEKLYEANYNLAKVFDERAIGSLAKAEQTGNGRDYQRAWLCSLAAVSKDVGPDKTVSESVGRLMRSELRTNAFRELWHTERPTELVEESYIIPPGQGDAPTRKHEQDYSVSIGSIGNVIFTHDGARLALLCGDNTVRIWRTGDGAECQRLVHAPFAIDTWNPSMQLSRSQMAELLNKANSRMTVIALAPDERLMASGLSDGRILLWDSVEGGAAAELTGHKEPISSIAFHPDGQLMAAASQDGLVSLWLLATLKVIHHVKLRSAVNHLTFSPDGAMLAVGLEDRSIGFLDAKNLEQQASLEGHTDAVTSLTFSPDGAILASASKDSSVRIWDMKNPGQQSTELTGHTEAVADVAFSADGKLLASGGADHCIRLWDTDSQVAVGVLNGHKSSIVSLAFCPNSSRLASVSRDHNLFLWQPHKSRLLSRWSGHLSNVNSVAVSPKGDRVASGDGSGVIRLWDSATGEEQAVLKEHVDWVTAVAYSPDGKLLASGSRDKSIRIWDAVSGESLSALEGHNSSVWCLAFSPDGKLLASGSGDSDGQYGGDHSIRLWNIESREELAVLRGHESDISGLVFSHDGRHLVSCSSDHFNPEGEDHSVHVWDVATRKQQSVILQGEISIHCLAIDPSGTSLALGLDDGTIQMVSLDDGSELHSLTGHDDAVMTLSFSRDGRFLASGSRDTTIRLWQGIESVVSNIVLTGHEQSVTGLAFSSDGQFLVSGSKDRTVRCWEISESHWFGKSLCDARQISFDAKGKRIAAVCESPEISVISSSSGDQIAVLRGHSKPAEILALSPDGSTLASGSSSGQIRLWDIKSGQQTFLLKDNSVPLLALTWSPDGREIAGLNEKWELFIWSATQAKLINHIYLPNAQVLTVGYSLDLRFYAATVRGKNGIYLGDRILKTPISLDGHRDYALTIKASPDSQWFASGSLDRTARLWNVVERRGSGSLRGHEGAVQVVDFSSDSKRMISGCNQGGVRVWDVESYKLVRKLPSLRSAVISVALSTNGDLVIAGSENGEVRLWEGETGREVVRLPENSRTVSVSFSPDGTWLVLKYSGESVRLWNVDQLEFFQQGGEAVGRLLRASKTELSYRDEGTRFEADPRCSKLTPVGEFQFPRSESETVLRSRRPATDPVDWILGGRPYKS